MAVTTVASHHHHADDGPATGPWSGGDNKPFGSRWGKLMMWFFLVGDAFTFAAFLVAYGMIRYKEEYWPNPEIVFQSFPGIADTGWPLVFVGVMTFILIMSSVTMVLAVDAGHQGKKKEVIWYLVLTIVGGAAFLGCQALEWAHLIHEGQTMAGNPFGPDFDPVNHVMDYDSPAIFGQLFFTITGFHGTHVLSGVVILVILLNNVVKGVYDKSGDYEMVEKVGLYWHFVDLVWVFVFTLFYLI